MISAGAISAAIAGADAIFPALGAKAALENKATCRNAIGLAVLVDGASAIPPAACLGPEGKL